MSVDTLEYIDNAVMSEMRSIVISCSAKELTWKSMSLDHIN
jgi:hypothetical protein